MSLKTTIMTTAAALMLAASAQAQVVLLPGTQTGSPGETVEFAFGYEGDGSVVSGAGFDIVYPADAPYVPVNTDGVVACTTAEGANADADLPFFDAARNLFAVSFGDFSNPIQPIGISGTIVRCQVEIKEDAALGEYPLTCGTDSAQANDKDGTALTATCTDGVLNIVAQQPTPTPTPEGPTVTPEAEATNTGGIRTTTRTIVRPGGGGNDEDDGCQVVAPGNSSAAWLLMIPAAVLLWQRRRSR